MTFEIDGSCYSSCYINVRIDTPEAMKDYTKRMKLEEDARSRDVAEMKASNVEFTQIQNTTKKRQKKSRQKKKRSEPSIIEVEDYDDDEVNMEVEGWQI